MLEAKLPEPLVFSLVLIKCLIKYRARIGLHLLDGKRLKAWSLIERMKDGKRLAFDCGKI
jgi:hypothetical protein